MVSETRLNYLQYHPQEHVSGASESITASASADCPTAAADAIVSVAAEVVPRLSLPAIASIGAGMSVKRPPSSVTLQGHCSVSELSPTQLGNAKRKD